MNWLEGSNTGKTWHFDGDDEPLLNFGHAAYSREREAITTLVKNYYSVAANSNGSRGCRLFSALLSERLPEEYGHIAQLRGSGCSTVLSKLFRSRRRRLRAQSKSLEIERIRVENDQGVILLRFGTAVVRHLSVLRERGAWTINMVFDAQMP